MKILVERDVFDPRGTLSKIYVDGAFFCYGLEDRVRNEKLKGETAIPFGTYEATDRKEGGFYERYKVRFRPWHRGMIWIRNVPGFEWILIHCGNTPADTEGCLIVGAERDVQRFAVLNSAFAYQKLYQAVIEAAEKNNLTIEYRRAA